MLSTLLGSGWLSMPLRQWSELFSSQQHRVHLLLQGSPRIAAGGLRDHRGDYFSESPLVVDNPYSPSFSGSFTSSFSPGVSRNKGAGRTSNGRISLLASPAASAHVTTTTPNAQVIIPPAKWQCCAVLSADSNAKSSEGLCLPEAPHQHTCMSCTHLGHLTVVAVKQDTDASCKRQCATNTKVNHC